MTDSARASRRDREDPARVLVALPGFPALVAGIRAVLGSEPGITVIGCAEDRDGLVAEFERTPVDVVITELENLQVSLSAATT